MLIRTGYKFETLSLMPATWDETSRDYIESRDEQIVSNKGQYVSVVRTGIGGTSLILGGEVDAGMCSLHPLLNNVLEQKQVG
jgi:RAT1-interacting protein